MSYSNKENYGLCKGCFKQQQFCTCDHSGDIHRKKQSFTEHNDQHQSIGEQDQKQQQEQGALEQEQGPQIQGQNQEGQRQGPQSQEQQQGPQSQGPQNQGPQLQRQRHGDQSQAPQLQRQRHGDQTMTNDQTIETPIDIDGVTVDVKCGDCKPTIIFKDEFYDKKKKRHKHGGEDVDKCKCKHCRNECKDCCVKDLNDLLKKVKNFQADPDIAAADKAIQIYFSTTSGFPTNPTTGGQVITELVECSTLRYKLATQASAVPNTVVQLCDVAGISATPATTQIYQFLLQQALAEEEEIDKCGCKKKKTCKCPACASGIGKELESTINFGIEIQLYLKGQTTALTPVYVLSVKDGIAYFTNSETNPTTIYVFSLCAISGYLVASQTI
ncbi:hypothetical protein [Mangrovibacillus cuniculi]|uniref:Uncharacterized protein n=1 Tax=Mangrovibacillus cuniculi TaxID=2593652 RepID=A0A7S8CE72_9BACI|nr:hypothetical protein [Mangrovibacillus cuniculi]QPC48266.1 hypothetical protein G8O30_15730 [Mangrovibacillus cuniculi]